MAVWGDASSDYIYMYMNIYYTLMHEIEAGARAHESDVCVMHIMNVWLVFTCARFAINCTPLTSAF